MYVCLMNNICHAHVRVDPFAAEEQQILQLL